jgi:DNA-binding MarR family transcriptional regulator
MNRRFNPSSPRRRQAVSRLDAHVGYWLRCASNQFSQALSRKLEDKGVTLAEWVVLRELYEGDRRPCALAETLGLTRGAISKLAARLVSNLMITQQASGGDGRAQTLALTELGRTTVRVLAVLVDANEDEFFGDLEPDTRALMVATLREIIRRHGSGAAPAD